VVLQKLVADASNLPEKLERIVAKLDTDEHIQEGVQTAMQETQGLGDYNGLVEILIHLTSCSDNVEADECVHKDGYVVGQPANKEHNHHSHDDLNNFMFCEASTAA